MGQLTALDLVVITAYFLAVIAVAWWAAQRRPQESAGYFLAGRDMGWIAVGASLFVSNIGSENLVGLAGTGAASGLAVGHFEWLAALALLLLAWLFVPFYLRSGVYTMPEFLGRRFNTACRWYFSLISILAYVLTKISVALYAGGVIIREVAGLSFYWSAGIVIAITGIYTIVGGLRAVILTDLMQAIVLVFGTTLLVYLGLQEVGGVAQLQQQAPEGSLSIWKSIDHPEFPWTGIVLGAPILAVWYWCTDQYIVQRALAANNEASAQTGSIFAGYLKILPMFLFVLPGVIAAVLMPELQTGLQGLFVAALLAALMSSLSSIFNSTSTLITWDIYRKLRPRTSERQLVTVGRVATAALVVLGLLWIPFMQYISSQLYVYLQSVQGYIAPPIAACFLLGLLMRRVNGAGAITSLLVGFVLGSLRLVLEVYHGMEQQALPPGSLWEWLAEINFLHFAAGLFVVCVVVLIGVSLLTAPPRPEQVRGLTLAKTEKAAPEERDEELPETGVSARRRKVNLVLSLCLVAILAVLYALFA